MKKTQGMLEYLLIFGAIFIGLTLGLGSLRGSIQQGLNNVEEKIREIVNRRN
ncbi:MAG: hypothetical protein QXZ20_03490 [Candidatus Aenigmatarchaeota archaeon]